MPKLKRSTTRSSRRDTETAAQAADRDEGFVDPRSDVAVVQLAEEVLQVGKRQIAKGGVRVRTVTDTVEEIAQADLASDKVEVTRVPVGREIEAAPPVRTEGEVLIVPVVEEILVIQKKLVLKEELHIRKQVTTKRFEQTVTLRRQRAVVERTEPDPSGP